MKITNYDEISEKSGAYSYEIAYNQQPRSAPIGRQEVPDDGSIDIGPYTADRRSVGPDEDPSYALTKEIDKEFTGTITIFAPNGAKISESTFKATVKGVDSIYKMRLEEKSETIYPPQGKSIRVL